MFTSGIDEKRKRVLRHAAGELGAALFCAVFGMIYEVFSHEVYSYYMIYAFVIPLLLGALRVSSPDGENGTNGADRKRRRGSAPTRKENR